MSGERAAGKRLDETPAVAGGCAAVGVVRDGEFRFDPPSEFRLRATDEVFAVGSDEAVAAAGG